MFCSACGKKIEDNSRFCEYCGAKQEEFAIPGWIVPDDSMDNEPSDFVFSEAQEPRRTQPDRASAGARSTDNTTGGSGGLKGDRVRRTTPEREKTNASAAPVASSSAMDMVMKIVLLIFGGLYAITGVIRFFGTIIGMITGVFMAKMFGIFVLNFFGFLTVLTYLGMAFLLVMTALGHKRENTGSLFAGMACCGLLTIVLKFLSLIVLVIITDYASKKWIFLPMLFVILVVAIAFGLMMMVGESPFAEQSIVDSLKYIAPSISGIFADLKAKKAEKPAKEPRPEAMKRSTAAAAPMNGPAMGGMAAGGPVRGGMGIGGPVMNAGPAPGVRKLDEHRGLIKYIIFGVLTCSIYSLYFIYKLSEDINIACNGDGRDVTGGLGAYIGYSILTCGAYSTCWQYSLADRIRDNAKRYGVFVQETGLTLLLYQTVGVLLCGLGPLIAMHKLCKNANQICAAYNRANGF